MYSRNWPRHLLALSLFLPLGTATACGPDFPLRLLGDRAMTLGELPEGSFQFEVNRLGKVITGLKPAAATAMSRDYESDLDPYVQARINAEQLGSTDAQRAQVTRLRTLQDAHQVLAESAGLAPELSLYTAGAVAFNAGDTATAATTSARCWRSRPTSAPQQHRAAYSLGRALMAINQQAIEQNQDASQDLLQQARQAFIQARQLSVDGFSDPLELGIASLGEEARVVRQAGDWNSAVELYATQSRQGSPVGYSSSSN